MRVRGPCLHEWLGLERSARAHVDGRLRPHTAEKGNAHTGHNGARQVQRRGGKRTRTTSPTVGKEAWNTGPAAGGRGTEHGSNSGEKRHGTWAQRRGRGTDHGSSGGGRSTELAGRETRHVSRVGDPPSRDPHGPRPAVTWPACREEAHRGIGASRGPLGGGARACGVSVGGRGGLTVGNASRSLRVVSRQRLSLAYVTTIALGWRTPAARSCSDDAPSP